MNPTKISVALTVLKETALVVKAAGHNELWNKVLDLQVQLVEIQQDALRQDEEMRESLLTISELKKKLSFSQTLTFQGYWYTAEGDPHPFCMTCWEAKSIAVHLKDVGLVGAGYRRDCQTCKGVFVDIRQKQRQLGQIVPRNEWWS